MYPFLRTLNLHSHCTDHSSEISGADFEFEALSWSIVQQLHRVSKLVDGDQIEVEIFRKILPEKTIGIFIRSAFPGMIWIGKIYGYTTLLFEKLPCREFNAVVERECFAFLFWNMPEPCSGQ